jgi:hypothetical protein
MVRFDSCSWLAKGLVCLISSRIVVAMEMKIGVATHNVNGHLRGGVASRLRRA